MLRKHELVTQVIAHGAIFAIDKVEGASEIVGANAHECAYDFFLVFAASTFFHYGAQFVDKVCICSVGEVEVCDDVIAADT